jgi:23S rRNA (cytosine1962-C5)-methyltransferase/23S rRNA (guanine2445-N2)-methyltransferase / 23S rRNA (guanine2069-N7)-methyltransferase
MSATYLEWSQTNFDLNKIPPRNHQFIRADVLAWLDDRPDNQVFDFIFLDPPTFSNSKRMQESFEVERDQVFLVEQCMSLLAPNGILYFSNNKRSFRMDPQLQEQFQVKNITEETIPRFSRPKNSSLF